MKAFRTIYGTYTGEYLSPLNLRGTSGQLYISKEGVAFFISAETIEERKAHLLEKEFTIPVVFHSNSGEYPSLVAWEKEAPPFWARSSDLHLGETSSFTWIERMEVPAHKGVSGNYWSIPDVPAYTGREIHKMKLSSTEGQLLRELLIRFATGELSHGNFVLVTAPPPGYSCNII